MYTFTYLRRTSDQFLAVWGLFVRLQNVVFNSRTVCITSQENYVDAEQIILWCASYHHFQFEKRKNL